MSEAVLRSCPFCGGEARHDQCRLSGQRRIGCKGCESCYTDWHDTPEEAVAAWNKRPTEDALVEALEQVVDAGFVSSSLLRNLKAALAKARGEVAQ